MHARLLSEHLVHVQETVEGLKAVVGELLGSGRAELPRKVPRKSCLEFGHADARARGLVYSRLQLRKQSHSVLLSQRRRRTCHGNIQGAIVGKTTHVLHSVEPQVHGMK